MRFPSSLLLLSLAWAFGGSPLAASPSGQAPPPTAVTGVARTLSPGEAFLLPFPGLFGPLTWEVGPFRPLLLPEGGEGLAVAVLEVPPTLSPGVYRVCAVAGERRACREVAVAEVRRVEAEVPARGLGGVALVLRNRGNVPERVHLAPDGESPLRFPPMALALDPGEERRLFLPFPTPGDLLLLLRYGGQEERYRVRVEGEGGAPTPYRLLGRLEAGYPLGGGLSLEGGLAKEVGLALRVDYLEGALSARGRFNLGPWTLEGGSAPTLALGYREGPLFLRLAYPPSLEAEWAEGGETYRLEASPGGLALAYAAPGFSVRAAYAGSPSFRLERLGDFQAFLAYEGGLRLGGSLFLGHAQAYLGGVGLSGEATLFPAFSGRLGIQGPLVTGSYPTGQAYFEVAYRGSGPAFSLGATYPLGPLWLGGRLGYEGAPHLGLSLGYREGGLGLTVQGSLGEGKTALALGLRYEEGPYALEGKAGWGGIPRPGYAPAYFELKGSYAFSLPVPEGVTLALGGYERVRVEGKVTVLGQPLPRAEVVWEGGQARADAEGRFRLWLPPEGARVRVIPPPGALVLSQETLLRPGEGAELSLPPASLLRLVCQGQGGRGAYVLGKESLFLPCGGQAVLPPGSYRLSPEAEAGYGSEGQGQVELGPLEERRVVLAFAPVSRETLHPPGEGVRLSLSASPVAPGEEVEASLAGEGPLRLSVWEGNALLFRAQGKGPFRFQVPWEAKGPLVVRVEGEGKEEVHLLPVDPSRELLLLRLNPGRAALGQEVEVALSVRFPAEGAELLLPDGRALPFTRVGEGAYALRLKVEEGLLREAEPLGHLLGVRLRAVAWQGERRVERGTRLWVLR
ncbi:MAG: hypothetical protein ABWJ63_05855 [Thermus sp.]|uniref:hypothetical protein n=1 Tax=Thermus sp. TaxID=275 RepID=UPI00351BD128